MGRRHGGWPSGFPGPKLPNGTCLYALKGGDWGYYTIKPSASETVASAETWLSKRDWEDWG
ncbi:MAG: hypothetical protein GY946_25125 [bacterium]|nr:hypothetical protein [bacterium]